MPKFEEISLAEFVELVDRFEFTRRIDAVHMHCTWRPRRADYVGLSTIEGMWDFHVNTQHWADIAQHVSISPHGTIWTGRDWNRPPASATGHNGTSASGPFMFEIIGDFDVGAEPLDGEQRRTVVAVIATLWRRFALPPSSLRFHREMNSGKTCPGTSVDKATIVAEAEAELARMRDERRAINRAQQRWAGADASPLAPRVGAVIEAMERSATAARAFEDGELPESSAPGVAMRSSGLGGDALAALRPYVVTMRDGRLAAAGEMPTTPADVDAIFQRHLPEWQRTHPGQPLRIMLWAHGGLNDEGTGLGIAHRQIAWWVANGVYPIHFVWETGVQDALRQLVFGMSDRARAAATRELTDVPDFIIENAVRLPATGIWTQMKRNAERCADAQGGARYVVQQLADYCRARSGAGAIEIYAAGHSAGSIFHAHLLPAAFAVGLPPIRELFLLAPAIRTDLFKQALAPLVGSSLQRLTMATMNETLERGDSVSVYKKSLLYLVSRACEGFGWDPILGLEISLRADPDLARLFALDGNPVQAAEVVWSDGSAPTDPRRASTSRSHGGFDDDGPTMDMLVRRVTGAAPGTGFPGQSQQRVAVASGAATTTASPASGTGRRLALCVGIDAYPAPDTLSGCVNDTREWQAALRGLGFEVRALENADATRAAILAALEDMVQSSRAGDVLVFQYAGHGTQLSDLDRDEEDGKDEALVPVDFQAGGYLLDDDTWAVLQRLPAGVNFTGFMDCCNSGSNSRAFGAPPPPPPPPGAKKRYMRATASMEEAHRAFRQRRGLTRGMTPELHDRNRMPNVSFAACQDHQVAYESSGHGQFTLRAVPLLQREGTRLTNAAFCDAVVRAFGANPPQEPKLDCADAAMERLLLAPLAEGPVPPAAAERIGASAEAVSGAAAGRDVDFSEIARLLRRIAELVDGGR